MKTVLMSTLPATRASEFWVHLGDCISGRKLPRSKRRTRSLDGKGSGGVSRKNETSSTIDDALPANSPTTDPVLITATFDDADACVELSYAKENGTPFTTEEVSALLRANSGEAHRKWRHTGTTEWASDDGYLASLGSTRLAKNTRFHWIAFRHAVALIPGWNGFVGAPVDRPKSIPRIPEIEVDAHAPKPPLVFRVRHHDP